MLKNNRGFTVIELITSFVFTSILAVSLFSVVLNSRDRQIDAQIKADLLAFKSQITIDIQKDIQLKGLNSIDYCMSENPTTHELNRVAFILMILLQKSLGLKHKLVRID